MAKTKKEVDKNKKANIKKRFTGIVLKNKMEDTVIVEVTQKRQHSLYKKIMETNSTFFAHCKKDVEVGDKVIIQQTRPISKNKHWKVVELVK